MSDKPILFSGPMVRALIAGTKTQTRRAFNPQPYDFVTDDKHYWTASGHVGGRICISDRALLDLHRKPRPGDRLYVREHWRASDHWDDLAPRDLTPPIGMIYIADGEQAVGAGRFRQGMHMPRWASRITLTVTDVRVERLQDISEEDAQAEGVSDEFTDYELYGQSKPYRYGYSALWQSINGPGSWDLNPWVAAYTFTVAMRNIDAAVA